MWVEVDLATVPPGVALHEADDLRSLKVVVRKAEHAHVSAATLRSLAGQRSADPQWCEELAAMVAYARSKGWVRQDGTIRTHVEVGEPPAAAS